MLTRRDSEGSPALLTGGFRAVWKCQLSTYYVPRRVLSTGATKQDEGT